MIAIKDLFLGNWRNKGVALFFAVTIWFAAYRSEKQEYSHVFHVELKPGSPGQSPVILTSIRRMDPQSAAAFDFDDRVRMVFSGPRKQIDKIRDDPPVFSALEIPRDREVLTFTQTDFGFPREGVEITQFVPESLRISQEDVVKLRVENLSEKLSISNIRDGFEVASKEVRPSHVQITGPRSLVSSLGVSLNASMDYGREAFKEKVDIVATFPDGIDADLVRRTVDVSPTEAEVSVVLRASSDVLPVESMRITFRVPPSRGPIKIILDDIVGDTIPVEFYGRKDEIARLRERLREQANFSLGVKVPPFDRDAGGQFTFTEDSLELYGFPGVQIRQHEMRRREKRAGWAYSVLPVKEGEK